MPTVFKEGAFLAGVIALVFIGAVVGGSIGFLVVGFPGA